MTDPVRELKIRADVLHRALETAQSLPRLRALTELRKADAPTLARAAKDIQRKHCLAIVAREAGFSSWEHALRVIDGAADEPDFGTLLYSGGVGGRLNHWFATYDEARTEHAMLTARDERRYLLAYKRDFFLVEASFIEDLGLDPDDDDWRKIGWDWARPRELDARTRLYGRLLARRPR